jgi:hypothetical protein
LNMRLEETEIKGSVNYLRSQHDAREVAGFVSILNRWINEACHR